jgi:hypothetical protein
MREFECADETITVGQGVVEAFIDAFGPHRARGEQVVRRHLGVDEVGADTDQRVPVVRLFGAMAELQDQFGGRFMRQVGSFVFDKAVFPPGIDTLGKGMSVINDAYYMNHSENAAGRIGGYRWQAAAGREGTMLCDGPYPCAFDLGIVDTIARRFELTAKVFHETGSCRARGDAACFFGVRW